jgi:hypothetical protein
MCITFTGKKVAENASTDVMILKIFLLKNLAKSLAVLLKLMLIFAKI